MIRFGDENENLAEMPFVVSLTDSVDNTLTVKVALPMVGEVGEGACETGIPALNEMLSRSRPVYPDTENVYEITFTHYIVYQTRNESYVVADNYEECRGKYFSVYTRSRLLDSLPQITIAQKSDDGSFYPGKWTHYEIAAQNHIIDVIATKPPSVRKLYKQSE